MTSKTILAVVAAGFLAATSIAHAEVARPYITLGGGVSILDDTEFSAAGTTVKPDANNPGWALMGAAGMGLFNNFRAELELSHRDNSMDPQGKIRASNLMANFLYDIPFRFAGFTPYIGAGAGYGRFEAKNIAGGPVIGTVDDHDWTWAYQGIAGVAAPITNNLTVSLDYRYLSTFNDPEYRTSTGRNVGGEYKDHSIMVGFRFSFGGPSAPPPAPTPVAAPAPAPAPAVAPAPSPLVRSFLVFFDFDRSDITEDARKVITQAADNVRKAGTTSRITLTGHADRAGAAQYNMRLSQRRADAVKAELVRMGVPANEIVTVAKGESDPLVPTADGVREPRNRRVEIVF
jgi:outer membrane protein OmpA-like peptidoglycan-associated protein